MRFFSDIFNYFVKLTFQNRINSPCTVLSQSMYTVRLWFQVILAKTKLKSKPSTLKLRPITLFLEFLVFTKVRSLFKDCKQTAGCTNFCTETGLCTPVSVQNSITLPIFSGLDETSPFIQYNRNLFRWV